MDVAAPTDLVVHLAWGPASTYDAWTTWEGRTSHTALEVDIEGALDALRRGATSAGSGAGAGTRDLVIARVPGPQAEGCASRIGAALFDALFAGELREPYGLSRKAAEAAGRPWRLVLVVDADPLGRVPWELLRDPGRGQFLACSDSVVRWPSRGGRIAPPGLQERVRISWVGAAPEGDEPLDLGRERALLETALATLPDDVRPVLVPISPPTPEALVRALQEQGGREAHRDRELHVLHFACHGELGAREGRLVLEGPDRSRLPVSASTLAAAILKDPRVRLVVLNACNGAAPATSDALSSIAALLAARGVPAVIGMQTPILDAFALQLTAHLYAGLVRGQRVDEALGAARTQLAVQRKDWDEQGPWAAPVLWLCGEGAEVLGRVRFSARPDRRRSFAVLPFKNISRDASLDSWRDGLSEGLITALRNAKSLQLVDRPATAKYRDPDELDLAAVGQALSVEVLLTGSYEAFEAEAGRREMILRARLVDAGTGEVIETFEVQGAVGTSIRGSLAAQILQALNAKPVSARELSAPTTQSDDAFDHLMVGIDALERQDLAQAIRSLRKAVELDPAYGDAHYQLGLAYKEIRSHDKALEELERALGTARDRSYGDVVWRFRASGKIRVRPEVDAAAVYVVSDNGVLYALHKQRRGLRWERAIGVRDARSLAVLGGRVFVAGCREVDARSAGTGAPLWSRRLDGQVGEALTGAGEILYVVTREDLGGDREAGVLWALDARSGDARWRHQEPRRLGAPLAVDGAVVLGSADGTVQLLDAADGAVRWRRRLGGRAVVRPARAEDVLHVSANGVVCALALDTGHVLWELPVEEARAGAAAPTCDPVVDGELLFTAYGPALLAVHRRTGRLRWRFEAPNRIGSIRAADGLVYTTSDVFSIVESGEHELLAIDQGTGQLYLRRELPDRPAAASCVDEGLLHVGCRDHELYALGVQRSAIGLVRTVDIWRQIGLVHEARGDAGRAVEALERCFTLDPSAGVARTHLIELLRRSGRIAKAIQILQGALPWLPGAERAEAEADLRDLAGLRWTARTSSLLPLQLIPMDAGDEPAERSPIVPSPTPWNGSVYLGDREGVLHAFDAATGARRWSIVPSLLSAGSPCPGSALSSIRSSVVGRDDTLFFGAGDGCVYAVRAGDRSLRWRYRTGGRVDSTPAVVNGRVYVGSDDHALYALDADSGQLVFRFATGGKVRSSPAVAGGRVYVGSYDGVLYALDADRGEPAWTFRTGDLINSSPAVAGGKVFLGPDDGTVYALDASTGALAWKHELEDAAPSILERGIHDGSAINTLGFLPSSPVVEGGLVLVGSHGTADWALHALDESTGRLRWTFPVKGEAGSPAVHQGVVYVGAGGVLFHDQHVYGVKLDDGSLLWRYRTEGDVLSAPRIAGDTMCCWSMGGTIYAFDVRAVSAHAPERDAAFFVRAADTRMKDRDLGAALQSFEAALQLDPGSLEARAGLADCFEALGQRARAQAALEELQELHPGATHTYWRLGEIYLQLGQIDRAIEQLTRYTELLPEPRVPFGCWLLGRAYHAGGRSTEALAAYTRAIEIGARFLERSHGTDLDRAVALKGMALGFQGKARLLLGLGRPLRAELDLASLSRAAGSVREAAAVRAEVIGLMKVQGEEDDEGAARELEQALARGGPDGFLQAALGRLYLDRLFRFEEAHGCFEQVLRGHRDDAQLLLTASESALAARHPERAHELAERALAVRPAKEERPIARFLAFAASLAMNEDARARLELSAMLAERASLPGEARPAWESRGLRRQLEDPQGLPPARAQLILHAIDFLDGKLERAALEAEAGALLGGAGGPLP